MIFKPVNFHLVKKTSFILSLIFDFFPTCISFYRSFFLRRSEQPKNGHDHPTPLIFVEQFNHAVKVPRKNTQKINICIHYSPCHELFLGGGREKGVMFVDVMLSYQNNRIRQQITSITFYLASCKRCYTVIESGICDVDRPCLVSVRSSMLKRRLLHECLSLNLTKCMFLLHAKE